ncbi:unnamed protein product [Ectocarpus sp. 13 AM-2016]
MHRTVPVIVEGGLSILLQPDKICRQHSGALSLSLRIFRRIQRKNGCVGERKRGHLDFAANVVARHARCHPADNCGTVCLEDTTYYYEETCCGMFCLLRRCYLLR